MAVQNIIINHQRRRSDPLSYLFTKTESDSGYWTVKVKREKVQHKSQIIRSF